MCDKSEQTWASFSEWADDAIELEQRRWGSKLPIPVIKDLMRKAFNSGRHIQVGIDQANRTNYDERSLIR